MKKVFLSMVMVSAILSCNKDQSTVKSLEGEWEVQKLNVGSNVVTVTTGTMEFESCKLKEDDCDGDVNIVGKVTQNGFDFDFEQKMSFTYAVSEAGKEIFITFNDPDGLYTVEADMVLEDNTLELEWMEDGDKIVVELEKDK